ncbi:hypothetical protein F4805DRAFT_363386 [Annulohypoxylon moriforme]|nr:hypothetical protein F4805DRAFT_363386 [Annulohypoxylon moriforme]
MMSENRRHSDASDAVSPELHANSGRRINHRRSHRKSRRGCSNCKKSRKKCDEMQPACSNCVRRRLECDFSQYPTPEASNSSDQFSIRPDPTSDSPSNPGNPASLPSISDRIPSDTLTYEDMELLHHFSTDPTMGLCDPEESQQWWQVHVPKIGFAHPFALHLILAFAAIHLAQKHPDRREHLITEAGRHQTIGLRGTTEALRTLHPGNSSAVYVAAIFASFCDLAFGPQSGEYLVFNNKGQEAKWFKFLKGVRSIMNSGVPPNFSTPEDGDTAPPDSTPKQGLRYNPVYTEPFRAMRDYILRTTIADYAASKTYMDAFDLLRETFDGVYAGLRIFQDAKSPFSVLIFRWLYLISDDFAARLQSKEPVALVIFAHFAVLFREMEHFWFLHGWPSHIVDGIYTQLEESERVHIKWPIDEFGYEPS